MISFVDFIWLIHGLLIFLYLYEVALFLYYLYYHRPLLSKLIKSAAPLYDAAMEKYGGGLLAFGTVHIVVYGLAVGAVPIFLILIFIACFYCSLHTEMFKDRLSKEDAVRKANIRAELRRRSKEDPKFDADDILNMTWRDVPFVAGGAFLGLAIGNGAGGTEHGIATVFGGVIGGIVGMRLGRYIQRKYWNIDP
ncbi:MAG: hypothetical protein AAFV54_12935, partial [Pseudomonadota bacterium]